MAALATASAHCKAFANVTTTGAWVCPTFLAIALNASALLILLGSTLPIRLALVTSTLSAPTVVSATVEPANVNASPDTRVVVVQELLVPMIALDMVVANISKTCRTVQLRQITQLVSSYLKQQKPSPTTSGTREKLVAAFATPNMAMWIAPSACVHMALT